MSDPMTQQQLVDYLSQNTQVLQALAARLNSENGGVGQAVKQANQATYTQLHGMGGIFSGPGLERDVVSAYVRPFGISRVLPLLPSISEDPRFASLTGFTATAGAESACPCDPAPAGWMKSCLLTAQFGRVARDTQTIEIDKVMLQRNRGDFMDLVLRGRVLGLTDMVPAGLDENGILQIVTKSEMVTAAVNLEQVLTRMVWQGSVARNNACGGYKEFPGLDSQIATGQVDAETNQLCRALDSDVKDFNYNLVCGATPSIVTYLQALEYYLRYNAQGMGLEPATWIIAMRPQLWEELSACWPCSFWSNRCAAAQGITHVVNDSTNIEATQAMRAGNYIDINGNRYTVVTDVGIFEHTNANNARLLPGQFASSVYFIPLTITGGFQVTYREHVDYRHAVVGQNIALLHGTPPFWTDDGVYMWAAEYLNFCYKLKVKTEQRIILRTPQLAGRIDHVMYSPLQHVREPFPDSPYHFDGGIYDRPDSTRYAVWLPRQ